MLGAVILFFMIRKSIVDGQFYPGQKEKLDDFIGKLKPKQATKCSAKAVIVPHAGYPFSAKVAIAAIAKIKNPKNIVMLGPNHTGSGKRFAITPAQAWQTPYGDIQVNQTLSKKIINSGCQIEPDSQAHKAEHCLEVELPILQYFFKNFTIIPIACSLADNQVYREVANQIFQGIQKNLNETLILASTDFTHYEPDEVARRKDRKAIEAILELNAEKFTQAIKKENITACGVAPVAITLLALADKLKKAELVLYQTSADAGGNYDSAVGYASIIFK